MPAMVQLAPMKREDEQSCYSGSSSPSVVGLGFDLNLPPPAEMVM
jgi:hypothetical protein